MMQLIKYPARSNWKQLLKRPFIDNTKLFADVKAIVDDVKQYGDKAVEQYTRQFDGISLEQIAVAEEEFLSGDGIPEELKAAISLAAANIANFHDKQITREETVETMPGIECRRKSVAIEKVGLYIPGGTAPLFSTLLMLGIPASLAGCKEIILCTPADKQGKIHPAILYTAMHIGIKKIFKVGGAQAIAAMAYGTATIPQVYKILGPGNKYVTAAKQLVQLDGIAIDMPAGPSEVCVLADETANCDFVAADLLSQAEHDKDSQVLLVTTSAALADQIIAALPPQMNNLVRKEVVSAALKHSKAIVVNDINEGIELVNEYAPEHLIIAAKDLSVIGDKIVNAGSVFLGDYSPESVGDYASGTNHVLPTNGFAKAYSGVSIDSFIKKITIQKLSKSGLEVIGRSVIVMAEAEGLDAHANAIRIRLKK